MMHDDDASLVQRALAGDERAFEHLLKRHRTKLMASILQVVPCRDTAEDVYQEKGKFLPWALRIVRNLAIDQFRRQKRSPQVNVGENTAFLDQLHRTDANPEKRAVQNENKRTVRRLIRNLPQPQREVLIMRHYNNLSFKDIARLTDVSINTALGRMRYAMANLRRMAEEQGVSLM
jgi:RNA polymerase sigma-70 factor (ECF subfamily)